MNDQTHFKLNGRIWIDTPEGKVLGHGRVELLERIGATGSIRQAALQMKMSYKQAWDMVKYMNIHLGDPVVVSQRGGKGGGKATITANGEKFISLFRTLQDKFNEFLKNQTDSFKIG